MNWKKERPLRGGKGLIKLSYFIFNIVTRRDQLICGCSKRVTSWQKDGSILILSREMFS